MKKIIIGSMVASLLSTTLLADQFQAAPGTKARSMGYAFSAIANNTSAVYYNPAGFVSDSSYSVATLEFGNASSFDETEVNSGGNGAYDMFSSDTQYFVGGGNFKPEGGWGLALYSLYDVYLIENNSNVIHQSNEVLNYGIAWNIGTRVAFGLGYGRVQKIFSSDESSDGTSDTHNGLALTEYESEGDFFQAGIKVDILKDSETGNKITLAYTYRSEAEIEETSDDATYLTTGIQPFNVPEEQVIGLGIQYATSAVSFLFAYDRKETTYTGSASFASSNTDAIGLEIGFDGFGIRGGVYQSTPQEDGLSDALSVKGTTVGAYFKMSQGFYVEAAADSRKIADTKKNTFASASLNFVF